MLFMLSAILLLQLHSMNCSGIDIPLQYALMFILGMVIYVVNKLLE